MTIPTRNGALISDPPTRNGALLVDLPTRDSALQSDLPTGKGALLFRSILLGIVLYRVTYLLEKELYLLDLSY